MDIPAANFTVMICMKLYFALRYQDPALKDVEPLRELMECP